MLSPSHFNRKIVIASLFAVCIILTLRTLSLSPADYPSINRVPDWLWSSSKGSEEPLWIDGLDQLVVPDVHETDYCSDRFSTHYLKGLRDHSVQYCPSTAVSQFTCFHSRIRGQDGPDSFCIGRGAVLDPANGAIRVDCKPRELDANETARGLVGVHDIKSTWFDTGPRYLIDKYVDFNDRPADEAAADIENAEAPPKFTLLVKREGNHNFWHSMMEIFSMTITFDVLRITRDPTNNNQPFFRFPDDVPNTQIVLLDDQTNMPWFTLWRMFAGREPVRLKDIMADPVRAQEFARHRNVIFPLPGGSNTLWHNDWTPRDCRNAPLLRLFARRVAAHAGVTFETGPRPTKGEDKDIRLTFLKRRGSRRLVHDDALLDLLRVEYPHVEVNSVDMGNLTLTEQLRVIQETDVLLGVHGAGLTHMMFMREGAGAVVEIQPEGLFHKGFRNLAAMTGHKYFIAQAEVVSQKYEEEEEAESEGEAKVDKEKGGEQKQQGKTKGSKGDSRNAGRAAKREIQSRGWQAGAVRIEEERFLTLVDAALKSLYNEGLRNHEVV